MLLRKSEGFVRYPIVVCSSVVVLGLAGCVSPIPAAPIGAGQVNEDIEQRIIERVASGQNAGFPDISAARSEAPPRPKASLIAAQQEALIAARTTLEVDVAVVQLQAAEAPDLTAEAAALTAAIEADRRAMAAEPPLSETYPADQ